MENAIPFMPDDYTPWWNKLHKWCCFHRTISGASLCMGNVGNMVSNQNFWCITVSKICWDQTLCGCQGQVCHELGIMDRRLGPPREGTGLMRGPTWPLAWRARSPASPSLQPPHPPTLADFCSRASGSWCASGLCCLAFWWGFQSGDFSEVGSKRIFWHRLEIF